MLPHQCLNDKKITTSVFKNIFPFLSIYFFNLNFELSLSIYIYIYIYIFFFNSKSIGSILKNKEEKNTKIST